MLWGRLPLNPKHLKNIGSTEAATHDYLDGLTSFNWLLNSKNSGLHLKSSTITMVM